MNRNESHGSKRVPQSNTATLETSLRKYGFSDKHFNNYHNIFTLSLINTQTLYDFNETNFSRIAV
jgi:hypothetical protein